ncbi:MAG: alanine dehydrogenase [Pseudomonadota bacterium]
MRIGVPKEIKESEFRVGLTPAGAASLVRHGHRVLVERDAGAGAGFSDAQYIESGAQIADAPAGVYAGADLIVKVKEPQPSEYPLITARHTVFAYLHLASSRELTEALLATGATFIAYETVTDAFGRLPLLAPMSEVAGRMAIQAGAHSLEKAQGGKGVLLGGVTSVPPGRVLIFGAGVVGTNAAQIAVGMGAQVTLLDLALPRLAVIRERFGGRVATVHGGHEKIPELVREADLIVGAVLVPGSAAPKLLDRALLHELEPGTVLVDVSIDQGGCFETSRPTTHRNPTYVRDGIVHYCVANIPGAVPQTATRALTNATLFHLQALANQGVPEALESDPHLRAGLNIHAGRLCSAAVGESLGLPWAAPGKLA